MILFAAAGWAGHALLDVKVLFPAAVVLGLVVAMAVPAKGCALPKEPPEAP